MPASYNLSIRKFLKQVGVTSQAEIEKALRVLNTESEASFDVKVVLTSEKLGLQHEITGTLSADKAAFDP
ncbi:MAG: DUF6494 family protein [Pseudomonadota bacterium]